jgi:hypothetical protein
MVQIEGTLGVNPFTLNTLLSPPTINCSNKHNLNCSVSFVRNIMLSIPYVTIISMHVRIDIYIAHHMHRKRT